MANLIGQSFGRYHILEQLGEGGMAVVYKAFDTRLERDVAVKVIRTERLTIETMDKTIKRFEREAKALAKLTHPNIVPITDYGEHDGKPYLVMPYLPGGTLKQSLGKPMRWEEAMSLLIPITRALHFAHQQGIIHRDVKPSNILITQSGEPMLTDFGIAKILLDTEETAELTGTGMGIGTPEYMSPEQFHGKAVDGRSDIYSLGVVCYEMITGRKPYQADTPAAIIIKQATDPLPRPQQWVQGLPHSLEKILIKALAKRPGDRYQSMNEMAAVMESLVGGKQQISVHPEGAKKGTAPSIRSILQQRRPVLWIGLGIVIVAGLVWSMNAMGLRSGKPLVNIKPTSISTAIPLSTATVVEVTARATDVPTQSVEPGIDCKDAQVGDEISLLYQWSGEDEERLIEILQPLIDECGIVLKTESNPDQEALQNRILAGNPPDILFWNESQLTVSQEQLVPMDELGANRDAYVPGAIDVGIINGKWVGLPVKSGLKTMIWYSPKTFKALGYSVPMDWDGLNVIVEQMVTDGNIPWSMGFESGEASGWTASDFIQDILLVQQGPEYVIGLIDGSIPYDDAGVKRAYETYGKWAVDSKYTVGGIQGTVSTFFSNALMKPFSNPPDAMMVKQSDWAAMEIRKQFPGFDFGLDYDFFFIPGAQGLQGGSDWMMAFSDEPAVAALVSYLSSPDGGRNWAKTNFGLTPNISGNGHYTDPFLQKEAQAFYSTSAFTPDMGDTLSGKFSAAEWKAIRDYLTGADLDTVLSEVAVIQRAEAGQ